MRSALEARDLHVERDGRSVLSGAGLALDAGRIVALTAPSGYGKTTLLRCCNGLVWPERGIVLVEGEDLRTLDPTRLRRRVGLVGQQPAMLPGSVAENVVHGVPGADAALHLQAAGLDPAFAPREAARLSGGERMRVGIARALSRAPAVLLLDEPTAALDGDAAAHIATTVRTLARGGLAVCVATHDLGWAAELADSRTELDAPR